MAASDQSDWYSSDESDNESRFSGRNSDVSSNIIGNGHTLDRDSDLESCESDLEEEIQHDSDAETIIDDSYVTNILIVEIFCMFFNDYILKYIVGQTNLYQQSVLLNMILLI